MKAFKLKPLAIALAATFATIGAAHAQSIDAGKVTVTGEGDKLGTGLIIQEDTPKAKSTVTKAQLEKQRATSNPYQALTLLPGVNSTSYDATGLFGGNLRVRGFNSDQMGFTIDGAPVNDSGSFSVFPQEYSDAENTCEISVTQGATDTEAPHVGASGGNVSLTTCGPEDVQRIRLAQTLGSLGLTRTFVRFDTGLINGFKGFVSYSHSEADKFRGSGGANRDHVDAKGEYKAGDLSISAGILYNNAYTNNYRALTLAQYAAGGRYVDFNDNIPQHLTPVRGTAQNEAAIASGVAYYKYAVNPFENYLATSKIAYQLNDKMRVSLEPYFWYGYGTGGTQQTSVAESSGGTRLGNGIADINGDGDTLDTIMVYRGSVTETFRPGATAKFQMDLDNQHILAGFWLERARHNQTQPATRVYNDGSIGNRWLQVDDDNGTFLTHNDGSLYQGRNQFTVTNAQSVFFSDMIELMDSKLAITPGLSYRHVERDYTNFANDGNFQGFTYDYKPSYKNWLPSLGARYQFTPEWQVFGDVSKNMKVPGNFTFQSGLVGNPVIVNGVPQSAVVNVNSSVKKETSVNNELGVRYSGDIGTASAAAYYVKFKNRIASAFNPDLGRNTDFNVGDSTIKGLEAEIGSKPIYNVSAYLSASYTKSTIDDDLRTAVGTFAPTSDKQYPDTPKYMTAASLQYADGPFLANLQTKYTGKRYNTLVNDLSIGGYTTTDLNLAYQLPDMYGIKKPIIRFNASNIFDKQYLLANSGSGSLFATNAAGNPQVYVGAPRFFSISLQADY
ncbi:TonB-dependent receptor [soil metagenome]